MIDKTLQPRPTNFFLVFFFVNILYIKKYPGLIHSEQNKLILFSVSVLEVTSNKVFGETFPKHTQVIMA